MPPKKVPTGNEKARLVEWLSEPPERNMTSFERVPMGASRGLRLTRALLHSGELNRITTPPEEPLAPLPEEAVVEAGPEKALPVGQPTEAAVEASQEEVPVDLEPTNPSPEDEAMAGAEDTGNHISSATFYKELSASQLKTQELQHQIDQLAKDLETQQKAGRETQAAVSKAGDVVATVDTLKETVKDMGDSREQETVEIVNRFEETDKRASVQAALLEQKPNKEDIPALMVQCAEGNQEMCNVILNQFPEHVKALGNEEPHEHHSIDEFLDCPECNVTWSEAVANHPKLAKARSVVLAACKAGDITCELAKERLESEGYKVKDPSKSLF